MKGTVNALVPVAAPTGPLPVYDWQEPAHLQEHDWDCSQESLEWCLWAYGRTPDDSWMEQSLQAGGYVNPAVGCTDRTGAGLARWLNDEYGEYGYVASNTVGVSFDDVMNEARTHLHPVAMGGEAFYHWVGVRGYDPMLDRLLLANPAPGWMGCYQTMTRQQFADLGSFNLVRLTHPAAETGGAAARLPAGIDVSSHQGYVDWAAVRNAGAAFGFTKATGGSWYRNPTLEGNWSGMQAAGLKRGAYHYAFEPSGQALPGDGPIVEADAFLSAVLPLGLGPGDMLVLDIEEGVGDLGGWALDWCRHVEQRVGFKPLVYTGAWFSDPHGFAKVPTLAEYELWLAAYQSTMPPAPAPWGEIAFWQFTASATVPGVVGHVDGNWFNGTLDELARVGKPGMLPSPEDPFAPWRGQVGSGLIELMEIDGTLPAQARSTWLPLGQSPADVESCMGQNGVSYSWTVSTTNQGFRLRPS